VLRKNEEILEEKDGKSKVIQEGTIMTNKTVDDQGNTKSTEI
jgi:hypothetical protein